MSSTPHGARYQRGQNDPKSAYSYDQLFRFPSVRIIGKTMSGHGIRTHSNGFQGSNARRGQPSGSPRSNDVGDRSRDDQPWPSSLRHRTSVPCSRVHGDTGARVSRNGDAPATRGPIDVRNAQPTLFGGSRHYSRAGALWYDFCPRRAHDARDARDVTRAYGSDVARDVRLELRAGPRP